MRLARAACVACGRPATNAHHAVPKGSPYFGDDVEANMVPLCGQGSAAGCHGAAHGTPYRDANGDRWTPDEVRRRIGHWLAAHPASISYVLSKLGDDAGRDFLRRKYQVEA